jgi:hypothetical protein
MRVWTEAYKPRFYTGGLFERMRQLFRIIQEVAFSNVAFAVVTLYLIICGQSSNVYPANCDAKRSVTTQSFVLQSYHLSLG